MFTVSPSSAFARRVYALVRSIPAGRVATYGDIAVMAGHPGAARAVGNVMRGCEDRSVPAHRVIAANGAVGGFGGWPELKRQLLVAEGLIVRGRRVKDFERVRWTGVRIRPTAARSRPAPGAKARPAKPASAKAARAKTARKAPPRRAARGSQN
jgi:O-6-methylguanine DNA methyltransferase